MFYGVLPIAIAATVLSFSVFKVLLLGLFGGNGDGDGDGVKIFVFIIAGIIGLFSTGIRRIIRVIENVNLTQDKAIFNFMKKRQG